MIAGAANAQTELVVTLTDAARGIADLEKNVAFEVASYLKQTRGVPLADDP